MSEVLFLMQGRTICGANLLSQKIWGNIFVRILASLLLLMSQLTVAHAAGRWAIDPERSLGANDELCLKLEHSLSEYKRSDERAYWATVQSVPYLRDPPWEELDAERHKDLVFKLLKLSVEGLDGFYGKASQRNADDFYKREASIFLSSKKNKVYVLRKKLLGSYDFGEHPAPDRGQVFVQLRNYEDYAEEHKDTRSSGAKRPIIQKWSALTFLASDDLSGPDPDLNIGLLNNLLRTTIFMYKDRPYIISADQYIAVPDRKVGFLTYCVFNFFKGE